MKKAQFYVNSRIFEIHLTPKARLVYFYLCKCANRDGQCFPSKTDISLNCDLGKTSVASALDELAQKSLINIQNQYQETKKGHCRQTSNLYTLLDFEGGQNTDAVPSKYESHPTQDTDAPQPKSEREINNKTNDKYCNKEVSSIYHCASANDELNDVLENAQLGRIADRHFKMTLESLIKQMYYSAELKIDGAVIPQELIHSQLRRIDGDTIAFAYERFIDNAIDIRRGSKYLMACLYNAINDYDIDATADVRPPLLLSDAFNDG